MKVMKVVIRADASAEIGSGHLMRCLTLAGELVKKEMQVTFLCHQLPQHLVRQILAGGHHLNRLKEPWPAVLPNDGTDLLIIDHYQAHHDWQQAMRHQAKQIMVIDDLAERRHGCDLLLNQNAHATIGQYYHLVPRECTLLLGPEYALLRPEFYHLAAQNKARNTLQRILVAVGGTDPHHLTEHILQGLDGSPWEIDVVMGTSSPRQRVVESLCRKHQGRWTLHIQTQHMAQLMLTADLAIGAGGSSHWERCLLGLPALVVTVAENQVASTRLLHQQGACRWLGDADKLEAGAIRNAVDELAHSPQHLQQMSRTATEIVPGGGGTQKVVKAIQALLAANNV